MPQPQRQHRHSRQRRHSRHRRIAASPQGNGITLIELLLVVVGGVVLSGAIAMVLSHIRSSSQLAALLRLQDQCGRVQFLINHEIQQAALASGGGSTLTLTVPGTADPISYSVVNNELRRSGPPINAQGRLDEDDAARDDLVVRGVQLFAVDVSNPRLPTYTITVRDAAGVTYTASDQGGAHCRVREINGS